MSLFASKSSRMICALFALFIVTGDLVADAVHDATNSCVTESQSGGCDSCPACGGCAMHTGAALAVDSSEVIVPDLGAAGWVPEAIDRCAIGLPSAIDHPPQLA